MLKALYVIIAMFVIGGYGWASWTGFELTPTKKAFSPKGVRSTSGGGTAYYRGGYRGGK